MANCLSRRDQNVYSIFQNRAPRDTKGFQKIPKWKKVFVKMDWLLTMITNHFEIPIVQNLETFLFFLHWLYDHEIYSLFFFNIDKIQTDKDVWNQKFIHFMQMLTLKQSLHLSKVYENIHDQKDK